MNAIQFILIHSITTQHQFIKNLFKNVTHLESYLDDKHVRKSRIVFDDQNEDKSFYSFFRTMNLPLTWIGLILVCLVTANLAVDSGDNKPANEEKV